MTPLIVAGALSLSKYVVDRISSAHSSAATGQAAGDARARGGMGGDFRSAMRAVGGESTSAYPSHVRVAQGVRGGLGVLAPLSGRLEQRLMQSPEVQSALNSMRGRDLVSMEIRADGSLAIRSGGEVREVGVSEELRSLCLEVYASRTQAASVSGNLRPAAVEIPLTL